jgi:hypothetical protein
LKFLIQEQYYDALTTFVFPTFYYLWPFGSFAMLAANFALTDDRSLHWLLT